MKSTSRVYLLAMGGLGIIAMMFILSLVISCVDQNTGKENLVESNLYLIGKWTGEGRFLNTTLNKNFGKVMFEIEINKDNTISGKVGEAILTKTSITKADYGFAIRGILDSKLKNDSDLDKDHLIILLVLPEKNREDVIRSDASFHVKSNYTFDFSMRVGGVILTKEF